MNWIAVNGGIIEIANNVITIIADSAERVRDIDVSRTRSVLNFVQNVKSKKHKTNIIDQERRAKIRATCY